MSDKYKILCGISALREFTITGLAHFAKTKKEVVRELLKRNAEWYEIAHTRTKSPPSHEDWEIGYRVKDEYFSLLRQELEREYIAVRSVAAKKMPTFKPEFPSGMKRAKRAIQRLRGAATPEARTSAFHDVACFLASTAADLDEAEANGAEQSAVNSFREAVNCAELALEQIADIVNSEKLPDLVCDSRLNQLLTTAENAVTVSPKSDRVDEDIVFHYADAPQQEFSPATSKILKIGEWLQEKVALQSAKPIAAAALFHAAMQDAVRGAASQTISQPIRSERQLRTMPVADVTCRGQDESIANLLNSIYKEERKVILVCGEAGMGKTTVALAAANRISTKVSTQYSPSDICIFDCTGLSTFDELSSLLVYHLRDFSQPLIPERIEERSCLVESKLFRYSQTGRRRLWVFDGFDEIVDSISENPTNDQQFLSRCIRASNDLRMIVTLREPPPEKSWAKLFGENLAIQTISNFTPEFEVTKRGEGTLFAHPLATTLVTSANRFARLSMWQQHTLEEGKVYDQLERACQYSWTLLQDDEREVLSKLIHLPGGVWVSDDSVLAIEWLQIFNYRWQNAIERLNKLGWLIKRDDLNSASGRAYVYKLRPALKAFVEQRSDTRKSEAISRRLIWFWARSLRQWSAIIAARVTDRVEPELDGQEELTLVSKNEESARYLIDLTRLNWTYSYRRLIAGECSGNIYSLVTSYLRGCICYCRMTGAHLFFRELSSDGIVALSDFESESDRASQWWSAFRSVALASCYGMKGRTHRRLGEWDSAISCLEHAVKLLEPFRDRYRRVRRELAWALTELGRVHHYTGEWGKAEIELRSAQQERIHLIADAAKVNLTPRKLVSSTEFARHGGDERHLASTLNIFGNLLNDRMEWSKARVLHFDALGIRSRLESKSPSYFRRYVAHCYNDLGNSFFYLQDFDEAQRLYFSALKMREMLVPNEESPLGQYIARTCNNIGNTFRKQGDWSSAQKFLERSLRIYRAAIKEVPGKFNSLIGQTLCNLGRVYYHQGRLSDALKLLQEADFHHSLASEFRRVRFDWIETCNFLALTYLEFRSSDMSLAVLMKADQLLQQSRDLSESNYLFYKAFTLNTAARVWIHRNPDEASEAEGLLRESIKLRHELASVLETPEILDIHFAQAWHDLGKLLKTKDVIGAQAYLERALEIRVKLSDTVPLYASRLVARTSLELGHIYKMRRRNREARQFYETAVNLFTELNAKNPNGFRAEADEATEALRESKRSTES